MRIGRRCPRAGTPGEPEAARHAPALSSPIPRTARATRSPGVAFTLCALAVAALAACDLIDPELGAERPGGGGGAAGTYAAIAQDVFTPQCATSACHGGSPPPYPPQLDPDAAYDLLVGKPAVGHATMPLVDPSHPENSYLLVKLIGGPESSGGLMPPTGKLDDATIAAIEGWIANGAPHD
jgi:hypothetical protein